MSPISPNGPAGVRQACWWLALLTVATLPFLAAVGYARSGAAGILAALLAGGVCCGAAVASLLVAGPVRSATPQAVPRILFGMLIRMGVPLAACMAMLVAGGPLVTAGAPVMVLVYYLLMLVAETWLLLRLTAARAGEKNVGKVS